MPRAWRHPSGCPPERGSTGLTGWTESWHRPPPPAVRDRAGDTTAVMPYPAGFSGSDWLWANPSSAGPGSCFVPWREASWQRRAGAAIATIQYGRGEDGEWRDLMNQHIHGFAGPAAARGIGSLDFFAALRCNACARKVGQAIELDTPNKGSIVRKITAGRRR